MTDMNNDCSAETVRRFASRELDNDELAAFADHLADCPRCQKILAEAYGPGQLMDAPPGFTERVIVRLPAARRAANSKNTLLFYSLRVAAAACVALALLFSGVLDSKALEDIGAVSENRGAQFFQKIGDYVTNFSPQKLIREVFSSDKAEK